jgi:lysophospholipase L1-like esterase
MAAGYRLPAITQVATGRAIGADDRDKLLVCTTTMTLTYPTVGTLGAGFAVSVVADGFTVTVDGIGSTNVTVADGEIADLFEINGKVRVRKGASTVIDVLGGEPVAPPELPTGVIAWESRLLAGVDGDPVANWADTTATYTLVAASSPTLKVGAAYPGGRGVVFEGTVNDMTQDVDFAGTPGEFTMIVAYHQKQTPSGTSPPIGLYTGDNTSFATKVSLALSTGTLRINKTGTATYSVVAGTGISHPFDTTLDYGRAVTMVTRRGTSNVLDAWMRGVRLITNNTAQNAATLSRKLRVGNLGANFFKGTMFGIWVWPRGLAGDETTGEIKTALDYIAHHYDILQDNGNFVAAGDSLTDGIGATDTALDPWPEKISNALIADGWGHRFRNLGTGGKLASSFVTDINGASTDITLTQYVGYPGTRQNVLTFWAGTNDLYNGNTEVGMPTAADVHDDIAAVCTNYRGEGWKVIVITPLEREAHAGFDAARDELRDLIIENWATYADAMVDVGGDARFAKVAGALPPAYFGADTVHLNTAGYAIVYDMLKGTVRTLLGAPAP